MSQPHAYARISFNSLRGPAWALVTLLPDVAGEDGRLHSCRALAGLHVTLLPTTQYMGPWQNIFNPALAYGHYSEGPRLLFNDVQWARLTIEQPVCPDEFPQYLDSSMTTDELLRAIRGEP